MMKHKLCAKFLQKSFKMHSIIIFNDFNDQFIQQVNITSERDDNFVYFYLVYFQYKNQYWFQSKNFNLLKEN